MLERVLVNNRRKTEKPTQINILQAIEMTCAAWRNVTADCIKNCWRKDGLTERVDYDHDDDDGDYVVEGIDDVGSLDDDGEDMTATEVNELEEWFG
jgi:hypothetical protein